MIKKNKKGVYISKEYIKDDLSGLEYISLTPEDTFAFECINCGNCCRNVESAVPLEQLDVFKIVRHMQKSIEEVVDDYSEMQLLVPSFPMLFMKLKPCKCFLPPSPVYSYSTIGTNLQI